MNRGLIGGKAHALGEADAHDMIQPSRDPTPSDEDITMTGRVAAACDAIDVSVHDQVVIGKDSEISFREEGLL